MGILDDPRLWTSAELLGAMGHPEEQRGILHGHHTRQGYTGLLNSPAFRELSPQQQAALRAMAPEQAIAAMGQQAFRPQIPGRDVPYSEDVMKQRQLMSQVPGRDVPLPPEVEAQQIRLTGEQARARAANRGPTGFGTTVHELVNPETGKWGLFQASEAGGLMDVTPPGYVPPFGREEYLKRMGQEQGKYAGEYPQKRAKATNAMIAANRQWAIVDQKLEEAMQQAETGFTTGIWSMAGLVPGTPQHNLASTLQTIKSNIGFDRLQEMRANSPTGGALGNVVVAELERLESVLGSLKQSQTKEQLQSNLANVRTALTTANQNIRDAYERDYGGETYQPPQGIGFDTGLPGTERQQPGVGGQTQAPRPQGGSTQPKGAGLRLQNGTHIPEEQIRAAMEQTGLSRGDVLREIRRQEALIRRQRGAR